MLTFIIFWMAYFLISALFGAKIAYIVMVPVSFVLVLLFVSRLIAGMTMLFFAQWAAKNEDKLRDAIVIEARGLDN
jgi:hypothetical protein